jgi:hypothetical protein
LRRQARQEGCSRCPKPGHRIPRSSGVAIAESFLSTLKQEHIRREGSFSTVSLEAGWFQATCPKAARAGYVAAVLVAVD